MIEIIMLMSIFMTVILIGILLLVFRFQTWATRRDQYYSGVILDFEERLRIVEKENLKGLMDMMKGNRELLEQIKTKIKK